MMRTTTRRPRRQKIEHGIQVALFDWRNVAKIQLPALELLHAIPNGAALKHGIKRTASGKNVRYSPEGKSLRRASASSTRAATCAGITCPARTAASCSPWSSAEGTRRTA